MMGKLEAGVKVTILFLLWSGKIIFWSGINQIILKLIFCVNHGQPSSGSVWPTCLFGTPLLVAGAVDTIRTGFAIPL